MSTMMVPPNQVCGPIDWYITLGDVTPVSIPGDADGDGAVDGDDAGIVAGNWLQSVAGGAADGDFNGDGVVDDLDATIMAANWGASGSVTGTLLASGTHNDGMPEAGDTLGLQTITGVSVAPGEYIKLVLDSRGSGTDDPVKIHFVIDDQATAAAAVPEPGMCVLLAGMLLLFVARRRR